VQSSTRLVREVQVVSRLIKRSRLQSRCESLTRRRLVLSRTARSLFVTTNSRVKRNCLIIIICLFLFISWQSLENASQSKLFFCGILHNKMWMWLITRLAIQISAFLYRFLFSKLLCAPQTPISFRNFSIHL
jgi:hypothetical protein